MNNNLILRAGPKAYALIKENGLQPDHVSVIHGAAGGPKWLILNHLDRFLFSTWFKQRQKPLFLIGASSGVWRFASVLQNNPMDAIDRFEYSYIHQSYDSKPSPHEVSTQGQHILSQILKGDKGKQAILTHPFLRLSIMAVRCKGLTAQENKLQQGIGMLSAFIFNAFHRKGLQFFFERALFYDSRDISPFFNMSDLPIQRIPLTQQNIEPALMASGSIPLIMQGVKNIPGASPGTYRDGGITDYHMNIPFFNDQGIVLFPHYTEHIIPGWLDKKLAWRSASSHYMENLLLIAPSKSFLKSMPYKKIPDRNDFIRFKGNDLKRIHYWNTAVQMSKILSDEFMEVVNSNKIKQRVKELL